MNSRTSGEIIGLALLILTLCSGCASLQPASANRNESAAPQPAQASLVTVPAADPAPAGTHLPDKAPGIFVHIDPVTGQVLKDPPAASSAGETRHPLLYSAPAETPQVLELPSPTPGGGVMVNLNGQFHTPLVATIDEHGHIKFEHRPETLLRTPSN